MGFLAGLEENANVGAGVRDPSHATRVKAGGSVEDIQKAVTDLKQSVRDIESRVATMLESRLGKISIEASSADALFVVTDAAGRVSTMALEAKAVRSVTSREMLDAMAAARTSMLVVRILDETALVRTNPARFATFIDRIVETMPRAIEGAIGVIALKRSHELVVSVKRIPIRPADDERALAALSAAEPLIEVSVPIIGP